MSDDDLSIFEVERGLLTGEIVDRQKDVQSGEWGNTWFRAKTVSGDAMVVVTKIGPGYHHCLSFVTRR